MKLDILGIFAHPDDAEISCGGTLIGHKKRNHKVGLVDLTQGEMGTRGTKKTRREEAQKATEIMNLDVRVNLKLPDIKFKNDNKTKKKVVCTIRQFRPDILITNALEDRHTDHPRAANLVTEACFISGLSKYKTSLDNMPQEAWRPKRLFYSIQSNFIKPDFVVDISQEWDTKVQALLAYQTQFYSEKNSKIYKKNTFISTKGFFEFIEARAKTLGHSIGTAYGEGFVKHQQIGVSALSDFHLPDLA